MAETITIEGQPYLKRNPLGVLGLSLITFGIYFFYWYYKVNDELRRFEHDESISPTRSLMAMLFGWIIIVPPFIAIWNTANHIQAAERRAGVLQQIEPVLVLVFQIGVIRTLPDNALSMVIAPRALAITSVPACNVPAETDRDGSGLCLHERGDRAFQKGAGREERVAQRG